MVVSLSATRSAAGTAMLKLPSAAALPVKVLALTVRVTVSFAANLPVTLPVMAMVPVFSVVLTMLSAVTGLRYRAVWAGVLVGSTV